MKEEKKDFYCRCGICDENFASSAEWDAHTQTLKHKGKVLAFEKMVVEARIAGEHIDIRGITKKIQEKAKKAKPQPETKQGGFIKNISDAYVLIEFYEMGSVGHREYLMACKYALEHFRKKYGKNSFWFRELFGQMQEEDWECSYAVRCLVHAEVIGCPHETIAECDKQKSKIEDKYLKGKPCQHCGYIEGVKDKWEERLKPKEE